MMKKFFKNKTGFTLLEMLLVIVILTAILLMLIGYVSQRTTAMRQERFAKQMQQLANASLAYYSNMNTWPNSISQLQARQYISTNGSSFPVNNPWGNGFNFLTNTTSASTGTLAIYSQAGSSLDAFIVAGKLPMAYVTDSSLATCTSPSPTCTYVFEMINIPASVINHARSASFASVYHSGACVQVPTCPITMTPQITVLPAAVSGVNDVPTGCSQTSTYNCPSFNVYPIQSFTAYAIGPATLTGSSSTMGACSNQATQETCYAEYNSSSKASVPAGTYWRVCLGVKTEKGTVSADLPSTTYGPAWGAAMGTVIAITRCVPSQEPASNYGSSFNVWSY